MRRNLKRVAIVGNRRSCLDGTKRKPEHISYASKEIETRKKTGKLTYQSKKAVEKKLSETVLILEKSRNTFSPKKRHHSKSASRLLSIDAKKIAMKQCRIPLDDNQETRQIEDEDVTCFFMKLQALRQCWPALEVIGYASMSIFGKTLHDEGMSNLLEFTMITKENSDEQVSTLREFLSVKDKGFDYLVKYLRNTGSSIFAQWLINTKDMMKIREEQQRNVSITEETVVSPDHRNFLTCFEKTVSNIKIYERQPRYQKLSAMVSHAPSEIRTITAKRKRTVRSSKCDNPQRKLQDKCFNLGGNINDFTRRKMSLQMSQWAQLP